MPLIAHHEPRNNSGQIARVGDAARLELGAVKGCNCNRHFLEIFSALLRCNHDFFQASAIATRSLGACTFFGV